MALRWYQPAPTLLMNHSPGWSICIACAHKFPDKLSLEEHACPAVSFICTCGMGFTDYKQMLQHRNGHNDMTSLQSAHASIMKEKAQDVQLREMKLRVLESIDQKNRQIQSAEISKRCSLPTPSMTQRDHSSSMAPALNNIPHLSLPSRLTSLVTVPPHRSSAAPSTSCSLEGTPTRALSVPPIATNVIQTGGKVNLTLQFQPAVVIKTKRKFHGGSPFMCAICRVILWSKKFLLEHITSHSFTQVHGCLHCGLLLLGNSLSLSHHFCDTYCARHRDRFTSGLFVFGASDCDKKHSSVSRCPHCPSSFFQPWHLQQHIKKMHSSKNVLHFPPFPTMEALLTQKAEKNKILQQSVQKAIEVRGCNVMNGVKSNVPDGKALQQTKVDILTAKKKESENLLENTLAIGVSVGQGKTLKVAHRVDDFNQQGTKVETVNHEQTQTHCRCVICGKNFNSTQMLGQHRCRRKLSLLRLQKLQCMPFKSMGAYRSSSKRPAAPYSLTWKDSEEMVTLRLQTFYDPEHEPAKNMKVEPERSRSPLFRSVAVQTKVEFDDGSYDSAMNSSTTNLFPTKV